MRQGIKIDEWREIKRDLWRISKTDPTLVWLLLQDGTTYDTDGDLLLDYALEKGYITHTKEA